MKPMMKQDDEMMEGEMPAAPKAPAVPKGPMAPKKPKKITSIQMMKDAIKKKYPAKG